MPAAAAHRRPAATIAFIVLPVLVVAVVLGAATIGPVTSSPRQVMLVALAPLARIGLHLSAPDATQAALIGGVRLPRVVLAALVGGALAAAGVVMQAAFRNPLAEPGVTGVSSGAAAGAVLVTVTASAAAPWWLLPAAAFAGAVLAVSFVQVVGGIGRPGSVGTLLLVGVALNALLGAVISAALANARDAESARSAMVWLNGDLTGVTWRDVTLAVGPIVIGTLALLAFTRELDLLALPDAHARAAGLPAGAVRQIVLLLAALVTAAGVAVTGVLAFIGLVVPHLVRLVVGPGHARLLPLSVGVGAIVLVLADTAARMTFQPVVLQTGTVTALVGAPVLLALVLRRGAR
ncbi:MAG: iron ABC transporter permease [Actinobacteria bacterium]|nr:iron ABC transporter permease [Actinomycetota bacterium]MCG2799813.1 iron ABC transporter permease [Cellulomonas sp.]